MAKIKIAAIADTTHISKSVQTFIDRHPELQDGAVIIKVDVEGSQGRRRTNEIRQFLLKMKYQTSPALARLKFNGFPARL